MLNRQLADSIQAVVKRITVLALEDSELRNVLQRFCDDYLDATDQIDDGEDDRRTPGGGDRDFEERPAPYENDYRRPARNDRPAYNEPRNYNEPRGYVAPAPRGDYAPRYEAPRGGFERGQQDRGGFDRGGDFRGNDRGGFDRGNERGGNDRAGNERGRQWERPVRSDEEELKLIEDRCGLKSKGARWAAERRRMINNGADFRIEIDPKDREIIQIAKQIPECFLWMNHPSGPSPANLNLFDDLASCYDVLAESAVLLRDMLPDAEAFPELFNRAMDLAAEAQSALRSAVYRIDGPNDNDQNAVFHWLKRTASAMQVFIQRYMRADDTANPTKVGELSDRIAQLGKELGKARIKDRERAKHMAKIRPLVVDLETIEETAGKKKQWLAIANSVDEAVNSGLAVTDHELRALLSPLTKSIPTNSKYPEGFRTVLEEYEQSRLAAVAASQESLGQSAEEPVEAEKDSE